MKSYIKVILLLLIPLALILVYALSPYEFGDKDFTLEKADVSSLENLLSQADSARVDESVDKKPSSDSILSGGVNAEKKDTSSVVVPKPINVAKPDSTKFRILFFGDSMLEGLAKRLCDYTMESGYDLTSVIWYSSSTKLWAETDTLQFFLNRVEPDYVMLCLGSNELFVRDLDNRDKYIARLVEKLSNYPFFWISPPNWKEDTGINQLIIDHVGMDRYFDSRHLVLERSSDHAHPTHTAAAAWMDTVMMWLNSSAPRQPLPMAQPTEPRPRKFRQYLLKPVQ